MWSVISNCGTLVASVAGDKLNLHSLVATKSTSHDIASLAARHFTASGGIPPLQVKIHSLVWEPYLDSKDGPAPKNPKPLRKALDSATADTAPKLAVLVQADRRQLVVVLPGGVTLKDTSDPLQQPIVIEGDPWGVSEVQWIPSPSAGAYSGSTLLAVSTLGGLDTKVYSLAATSVLVTIPKPYTKVLPHPAESRVWSVVAHPYTARTGLQRPPKTQSGPALLHFFTDGVGLLLMAELALPKDASGSSQVTWLSSGKWLAHIDRQRPLGGYTLAVYNFLGIHDKPTASVTHHRAQATLVVVRLPEQDYTADFGLDTLSAWCSTDADEYVVVVLALAPGQVRAWAHVITQMVNTKPAAVLFSGRPAYMAVRDHSGDLSYRKVGALLETTWTHVVPLGLWLLCCLERGVALLETTYGTTFEAKIEFTLHDVRLLAAERWGDMLVMAFSDHIAAYTSRELSVVASSRFKFSDVKLVRQGSEFHAAMVEDTPGGPVWRRIDVGAGPVHEEVTDTFQDHKRRRLSFGLGRR